MGYAPIEGLEVKDDLRPDNDMIFYKETLKGCNIKCYNLLVFTQLYNS